MVNLFQQGPYHQVTNRNRQQGTSLQDYLAGLVGSAATQYMVDPMTQYATGTYLSRDMPGMFRAASTEPPHPNQGALSPDQQRQRMTPQWLGRVISNLSYQNVYNNLPSQVKTDLLGSTTSTLPGDASEGQKKQRQQENQAARGEVEAGLNWFRDYLNTAKSALGPDATRAQQQQARAHLQTLEREAPEGAGRRYLTLAENLTNPVTRRPQYESIFSRRSISQPSGSYRRAGLALRNEGLT